MFYIKLQWAGESGEVSLLIAAGQLTRLLTFLSVRWNGLNLQVAISAFVKGNSQAPLVPGPSASRLYMSFPDFRTLFLPQASLRFTFSHPLPLLQLM